MRGIAALIVAMYHFGEKHSWKLVPQGYLAVDFFFLLSGFVLAHHYGGKLGNDLTINRFVTLRVIRLYPLHLLGLIIGAIVFLGQTGMNGASFDAVVLLPLFANALMLPSTSTPLLFPFNGAQWSIFIELLINLMFALLLYRMRSSTLLLVVLAGVVGLLVTVGMPFFFDMGWAWTNLPGGLLRALFAFPTGMLMSRLMSGKPCTRSPVAALACATLFALLFAPVPRDFQIVYEFAVVLIGFPIVVLAGVRYEPSAWLKKPFGFLGDISYAIYAIHPPLAIVLIALGIRTGVADNVALPLYLVIICAIATLCVRFYDAPLRAALSRYLHVRRTAHGN
ncbi:MAG: acyltransferase [Sphingomonadales bacterium]